ncbi:MAG: hypothetical protein KDB80_09455 [Planctomycetes bacterium]|nr:hypothetical protein [Planctomycetota bacterium]
MTPRSIALCSALVLVMGCESLPHDDFDAAQVLLARGDLLGTIQRLDRVPPADERYPESRTIAQAIERRVRSSHALLNRGMRLRAEWRDEEAARNFERALEIWPELEAASAMLAATRFRIETFALDDTEASVAEGEVVETAPLVEPAAPAGETIPMSEDGEDPVTVDLDEFPDVASRCAEIERMLDDGLLEAALDLAESGPRLPAGGCRDRLTGVLHQRALVHYGHGSLELALNDWVRLRRIDPDHALAHEFSAAARAELAQR